VLDFGWAELLVVMAVAVLVIGPQDIPKLMHSLGRIVRRLQYVRFALSQQFEDFLKEHDLDELRRGVNFESADYDEAEADSDREMLPLPDKDKDDEAA
jgi:sec-independent protein translocase protein TatB